MIKKRLLALMAESKTYIIQNIFWQWLGLLSSIITMGTAGWLFQTVWDGFISLSDCLPAAIVIVLCIGLRAYCSRRASAASANAGNDVKQELRQRLYEKLTRLGSSYHEKVPTAEAVQVAVEGVEQLEVYFGKYIPQLFYSILAPITLFVVLAFVSLKASLVLLICVPLIPLTIMGVQKLAKRLLGRYWGIYTELGDSFLENLQGLTTLKIYQADGKKAKEMDQEAEHFRKITMKVLMMQLNSIIVMDVVAYGGAALGMIAVLREFASGTVSLGGTVTMILLSAEFFIPMRLLGSFFHIAMNGMAASDRLFAILDLEEGQAGEECLGNGPASVIFRDVCFSYDGERQILDQVSFQLPENGLISLVGTSGCGKSTIAGLLTGRNRDYRGTVWIGGKELSRIREDSLLSHVTMISHNSYLFKGTVRENLLMAAPMATEIEMETVLKKVNLYEFLKSQRGLDTELMERGSNFSGGQCQRLALARALLHDTPIYIFDEATSNIDAESEEQIMEVIRELSQNHCVLLISHRLANVVDSRNIYVLSGGRLTEEGTHNELMGKKGIYAALYSEQNILESYGSGKKVEAYA
ncbi:cysteine ABC transporter ATP-binding protein [Lachnoclostridium sp. An14]|uniref:ABC transporter ATP-binding protein/permease n=1 Tax=Lachnoclostridium sp. An14 TaxID=1965562 RepID=UPI000B394E81|nr:ABC transporter ATP-binding protein/permease [Lachnoclostridium sp. An14]OUQ20518.1 cysteine ABC transporter ATP-binding protein [Lachnoclostridium sp. An14]